MQKLNSRGLSPILLIYLLQVKGSSRTKVGGVPPETFITVFIHKDDGVAEFSVYQRSNDRTACFL